MAPDPGLDAAYATGRGYRGTGVRFSDCEYGWNAAHEDLNAIDLHLEPGQTIDPGVFAYGWDEHGTAAAGVSNGTDNGYGITGFAGGATVWTYPEWTVEEGFRRVTCIAHAIADSAAGDVVLLEMQDVGAGGGYGPAELDPSVFAVVKAGTDAGVVVVAAAGNGDQDLDSAAYAAYRALGDSGAILIGAGSATTSHDKLSFSTYGSRVNVQAWGESVFTLGYGYYAAYGGDKNQRYTASFNGTSSASSLAGPAAAVLQEAAAATLGAPLAPLALRGLLIDTGIPQGAGGHIGPCIDLRAAIERIDVMASATVRNGTGTNPAFYSSTSLPVLATTWTAEVDGSGHPGAGATAIVGYSAPLAPTPSAFGEILVDVAAPFLFASWAPSGGGIASHANLVPGDPAFVAFRAYTQAVVFGAAPELGNAIDLRLGY
ncbi:MAG: S8 family serine peptidase [Planctomycetota bacterium]